MIGIIDDSLVQLHQVLVGVAAPDVKSGRSFIAGLDARQQLYDLQHVRLSQDGRQLPDFRLRNIHHAHTRPVDVLSVIGVDDNFAQRKNVGFHFNIQEDVLTQVNLLYLRLEPNKSKCDPQTIRLGQRNGIKPVVVSCHPDVQGSDINIGADKSLAITGVRNCTANSMILGNTGSKGKDE